MHTDQLDGFLQKYDLQPVPNSTESAELGGLIKDDGEYTSFMVKSVRSELESLKGEKVDSLTDKMFQGVVVDYLGYGNMQLRYIPRSMEELKVPGLGDLSNVVDDPFSIRVVYSNFSQKVLPEECKFILHQQVRELLNQDSSERVEEFRKIKFIDRLVFPKVKLMMNSHLADKVQKCLEQAGLNIFGRFSIGSIVTMDIDTSKKPFAFGTGNLKSIA